MPIETNEIDELIKEIEKEVGKHIETIFEEYYFRGENGIFGEYSLSSLLRIMTQKEKKIEECFKRKALVLNKSVNAISSTDSDFTSRMVKLRHDGISTPLIDFSKSLYVALFFACIPRELEKCSCKRNHCNSTHSNKEVMEGGCLKIFKRSNFDSKDYKEFDKEVYKSTLLFTRETKKSIIIHNSDPVHPNIRKQQGVLCFSFNGKEKCTKRFIISVSKKEKILKELEKININEKSLFTGQESLDTSILLDSVKVKTLENIVRNPNKDKVVKIFNNNFEEYNKNIVKECLNNRPAYEDKMLILKNAFQYLHFYKKNSKVVRNLKDILILLEEEHYYSDRKDLGRKTYVNHSFINGWIAEIASQHRMNLILYMFEPLRVFHVDGNLITFPKLISFIIELDSWFNFKRDSSNIEKNSSKKYFTNQDNIKQIIGKMEKIFEAIITNWLDFVEKNFWEEKKLPFESVLDMFCVIEKIMESYKIFFLGAKDEKNETLDIRAKATLHSFSIRLMIISLTLTFSPRGRFRLTKDKNFINLINILKKGFLKNKWKEFEDEIYILSYDYRRSSPLKIKKKDLTNHKAPKELRKLILNWKITPKNSQ